MDIEEQFFKQLKELSGSKTILVGIGNALKGDDGAGSLVCQQLEGKVCLELIDAGTVPENYIQPIIKKAPENLLIVDAIDFGANPGSVKVFKSQQLNGLAISTHRLSPCVFAGMIQGTIDVNVYFIGIQPARLTLNQPLSVEVGQAVQFTVRVLSKIFPATKRPGESI